VVPWWWVVFGDCSEARPSAETKIRWNENETSFLAKKIRGEKWAIPKGNESSNHHFSGAMLNFGGVPSHSFRGTLR